MLAQLLRHGSLSAAASKLHWWTELVDWLQEMQRMPLLRKGCCPVCVHVGSVCVMQMTVAQAEKEMCVGDLVLFANPCSLATCCIRCFTRSDFGEL